MERAVGWFVFLATVLLLFGFGYYIYHTAEHKGWFKIKAPFFTFLQSSAGLSVGDPVVMMGFAVGTITSVEPQKPYEKNNVKVEFEITEPYFRYLWTGGSYVKVNAAGFLNQRQLEVTRATNGYAIVVTQPVSIYSLTDAKKLAGDSPGHWQMAQDVLDENSNVVFHAFEPVETVLDASNADVLARCTFESNSIYIYHNAVNRSRIVASWHRRNHRYQNFTPNSEDAYLHALETPPIGDQLQAMVAQVQAALPGILALTNKLSAVLDNANATLGNAALATSNLNTTIVAAQPMVTNFAVISAQLREPGGVVNWALGTNGDLQLQGALTNLNSLLANSDTNLNTLTLDVGLTLDNLAGITSNLNVQVQQNSNLLWGISKTVTDSDDFIQGLKHHWLLRSAFRTPATNRPAMKKK
jgi:hypothetical protein